MHFFRLTTSYATIVSVLFIVTSLFLAPCVDCVSSMASIGGKLYFRSPSLGPKSLLVISPDTLQVIRACQEDYAPDLTYVMVLMTFTEC